MEQLLPGLLALNEAVNGFVWGPVMLIVLVGTGVYLSVRTGFFQIRKFGYAMRNTIGRVLGGRSQKADDENISGFQAVSTALASTVGTGNVVGVATAISLGGPGAVFWMWVSAFFGMMTKYAEIVLAMKYRHVNSEGRYVGGPMYYIHDGLKQPWLAYLFAIFATLATFGIGNMTQANSIAGAVESSFGVDRMVTGIVLVVLTAVVILGGIKSIARVTEKLVPVMAVFFVVMSLALLALHAGQILPSLGLIVRSAFDPASALGGAAGFTLAQAIRMGVARGVFSNEAGLGSAPIAHAASNTREPVEQGLWGIFEVFVDTIVICTMTALVIVTTGVWQAEHEGAALTIAAFNHGLPGTIGGIGLTIGLAMFAYSTILGWSYYGEKSLEFLFRHTAHVKKAILVYRIVFVAAVLAGAVGSLKVVWDIADTLNGLMAIPNLIGVLLLSGVVVKETRSYVDRQKSRELQD
ncbi:alanine/glycine:cation symporter family protein [Mobilicoccus pelagius]|uniref:Putative sodium/amino acid symporter n=1 Tax=Mobilicoccus pelagius NBRC 104925 TaxID=1089455 RepID=H5UPN2_9MICO|nr:sodium:alanine symporter family protein [Mobilicoccus pelagius]GAB47690.1 putative sodium/amino acid symporter [Mobilicoccus pelagius NBRC 104925]